MNITTELYHFREKIINIIKNNNYDYEILLETLSPIDNYADNQSFMLNLETIVEILTKDRNDDDEFDLRDLELMKNDIFAMSTLINSILISLNTLPQFTVKYEEGNSELLIAKLLIFIFIILVPKKKKDDWTIEERIAVTDLCFTIVNIMVSSNTIKELFRDIYKAFKKMINNCVSCLSKNKQTDIDIVVDEKLENSNEILKTVINNHNNTKYLYLEIETLKSKIDK